MNNTLTKTLIFDISVVNVMKSNIKAQCCSVLLVLLSVALHTHGRECTIFCFVMNYFPMTNQVPPLSWKHNHKKGI